MRILLTVLTIYFFCVMFTPKSYAGEWRASIGYQIPLGTPDRLQDDSPALVCDLSLPEFLPHVTLWGKLEKRFKDGLMFDKENRYCVGTDIVLAENLILYSFYENRYSVNNNRIMLGVKVLLKGGY